MRRNSWILALLCASLLVVVGYRFEEYQVAGEYLIYTTAACDSARESCFILDCDLSLDAECDQTPYKKIALSAGTAPACALEHTCESFECPIGDNDCEVTLCNEETLEEGEACSEIAATEEIQIEDPVTSMEVTDEATAASE